MRALKVLATVLFVVVSSAAVAVGPASQLAEEASRRGKDVVGMENCEPLVIGEFEVTGVMICD